MAYTSQPHSPSSAESHAAMPAADRTQLNVRVSTDTLSRLQTISIIEGESVSDLVRTAVTKLIAEYAADPDFREKRRQYLEQIQGEWDGDRFGE